MKEGWKYERLGNITTSINGLWKGKKEPFVKVGVIRNANFNKDITLNFSNIEYLDVEERQYKFRKLQDGDLIVEKSGGSEKQPVGRTVLFRGEGDFSVSNFTSILRINDKCVILPEFLYKYLLFVYYSGATRSMQKATTGIHNILYDKFLEIRIPIPPLPEQERIVSLLDAEFAKIDAIKANAEKQLQDAKALFQSALKDYLTPKEGWEEKRLDEICSKIIAGGDAPNKDFMSKTKTPDYPYPIFSNGVENRGLYGYTNQYKVSTPAITIAARGTIGATFIRLEPFTPVVRLITIIPNDYIDIQFLYYLIKALNLGHTGTTIPQLTVPNIREKKFKFPDKKLQLELVSIFSQIDNKVNLLTANYEQTVTHCNDLKQSILKDIFS